MTKAPPAPPENRSPKGPDQADARMPQPPVVDDRKHHNADEQGER